MGSIFSSPWFFAAYLNSIPPPSVNYYFIARVYFHARGAEVPVFTVSEKRMTDVQPPIFHSFLSPFFASPRGEKSGLEQVHSANDETDGYKKAGENPPQRTIIKPAGKRCPGPHPPECDSHKGQRQEDVR